MEAIEIGDLISSGEWFMVVQRIDHALHMFEGNFSFTQDDAEAMASTRTLAWGMVPIQSARKIRRLKDLPPTEKICTCTTLDLFRAGCGCGAITPYKQVY